MISFFAHKAFAPQPVSDPGVDTIINLPAVLWNDGACFDPATSRFTPPAGVYCLGLSINIANPTDGGKHYALIRKNGGVPDFELLNPSRMSGSTDTVGTQCHGIVIANGSDYFEAVFQHSNGTGSRTIDGPPWATYFYGYQIANVLPAITEEGTIGTKVGSVAAGTYTYVDRSFPLRPGKIVTALGLDTTTAGVYSLKIVKRNSAGSYDVIRSQDVTHGGSGKEFVTLSSSFTIPQDEHGYYVGAYTTGVNHGMIDWKPRSYAVSNISGSGVTMTEQAHGFQLYVLPVYAQYA